jgi:hypothetical protein
VNDPSTIPLPNATSRPSRIVPSSGYLLFEVLLALAILTIVVVLVFRIIQTTIRATTDVVFFQTQQEEVDGLFELFRQNFAAMPVVTQFQTRLHQGAMELIFRRAPFTFSRTSEGAQFGTVVVSARPQPNGRLSLGILQEPENSLDSYVDAGQDAKANWFVLVAELDRLSWRFYDPRANKWRTDWNDTSTKPALVELTFRLVGQSKIQRGVFPWPVAQTTL